MRRCAAIARENGLPIPDTGLRHGDTFPTLEYIHGLENLVFDMYDDDQRLIEPIRVVESSNQGLIDRIIFRKILALGRTP